MSPLPVKVINSTTEDIFLKEGNAGVYRPVATIGRGDHYVWTIDPNQTYREYLCAEQSQKFTATLTSDDCIDNEVITISKKGTNELDLKFTPRKKGGIAEGTTDASIGRFVRHVLQILGIKRKDPLPQTPPPAVAPPQAPAVAPPQAPAVAPPQAPAVAPPQAPAVAPPQAPAVAPPQAPAVAPPQAPAVAPPPPPAVAPQAPVTSI